MLALVTKQEPETVPDIYEKIRKQREAIDWAAVHVRGDHAPAVTLADRIRRVVRR